MPDRAIGLSKEGLRVGEKSMPFISGSVHYWRHERSKWQLILDNFVDLGFGILQTYVPWSVHEISPGEFDFGQYSPNKNLPEFLDLCHKSGLWVILRPGPHINAEITYFGYPKRLFENPENIAVSATGRQVLLPAPPRTFPVISYNSEHFFQELTVYFEEFARVASGFCYPEGPVIGIQSDNEMSYFFRTASYDHDYSHWTLKKYQEWLLEKYGSLEKIRDVYHRSLSSISEISMPESFQARNIADLPFYIDWSEFKEEMLVRPLERIMEMLSSSGFAGLLKFHNYPMNTLHTPFNISRGEKTFDFIGVDYYYGKTDYNKMRLELLALCGASRFPFSPEFSSGCFQAWAPINLNDQVFTTYLALAMGLRGMNFYMIAERERWYGSPIKRDGELRGKYADFFLRFNQFIDESAILTKDRVVDALVLRCRDYDRLEKAADLLSPLPPLVFGKKLGAAERCHEGHFGFDYPIQIEHETVFDAWITGLTKEKIAFNISDTDINAEMLALYKVVFLPTFDFMSRRAQMMLAQYAEEGGILVIGPDIPSMDEVMNQFSTLDIYSSRPVHKLDCEPDTFVFNAGAGRIVLVNGLFDESSNDFKNITKTVIQFTKLIPIFPASGSCETSTFTGADKRTILFIINPTDAPQRPRITTGGGLMFIDLLTNEEFHGGDYILVHLDPYSIRPLEVKQC